MAETTLSQEVDRVIERFASDEVMLDALLQWASNPTSMSAGYGLEQNYPYIARNLAARHGISRSDAEKRIEELRHVCDSLEERTKDPKTGLPKDTGDIQRALLEELEQEGPQRLLRQGVLRRLHEVSEETRRVLLVFALLQNAGTTIRPDSLRRPADYYSDPQSEFQAHYKSVFGDTVPVVRVVDELVRCGAYSELYWVPSPRAKSSAEPMLVKAVFPTIGEIGTVGTPLPSPPNIPALLESHWRQGDVDLLRIVDLVSHSHGGVLRTDEPLPVGTNRTGFMGVHGQAVAISPMVAAATRQQIELVKSEKMEDGRRRVEDALVAVARRLGAEAALGVLWTGMGEVLWRLDLVNSPALYMYLAPWLTTFAQSPGLSRINLSENPHILFIIPHQSRPSLLGCLERTSGFSLKDTRWEKSLYVLTDSRKANEVQVLVGQRHRLLDDFLEELGHQGAPPPQVPTPVQPAPEPKPPGRIAPVQPSPMPGRLGQLELGDRADENDLRRLMQDRNLDEDQRRQDLTPIGGVVYPLATATTHTAIFGTTGSGKSVTTKRLVQELVRHGIPVTIIDWHDEYVELMRELAGIVAVPPTATTKPGTGEVPFTWNVLDPRFYSTEVTPEIVEDYVEIVVELLAHKDLMALTEPMKGGLTEALKLAYQRENAPTFKEVVSLVNEVAIPPGTANALQRRLQRFSGGSLGSIFCTETSFDPAETFARPMAVRAKHLTADHQSAIGLLTFFLLRQAVSHFKRMGEVSSEAPVRHVIVIDEAPMVIRSNPKVEHEVVRMLQEVRKFGEGLVLVCRNPGISDDILRETNQKIAHKLDVNKDVSAVGNMLGLGREDRALLRSLPRGVAFARIAGNPTVLVRIKVA